MKLFIALLLSLLLVGNCWAFEEGDMVKITGSCLNEGQRVLVKLKSTTGTYYLLASYYDAQDAGEWCKESELSLSIILLIGIAPTVLRVFI